MNYLYHYGVKGMKWGVIRSQDQLSHRIKRYTSPNVESAKAYGKVFVNRLLAMTVPGYSIVVNAATVKDLAVLAKSTLDWNDYTKKEGQFEKLSKVKRKTIETSTIDDLKRVNPRLGKQSGTLNNCMYCTSAMEMRARGYDVRARKSASGKTSDMLGKWFDGATVNYINVERGEKETRKSYVNRAYDKLCTEIEKNGNGSHGFVGLSYEKLGSGHAMYWKVENGKVQYYDGQNKSTENDKVFALGDPKTYQYSRLDNLKLKNDVTESIISVEDRR